MTGRRRERGFATVWMVAATAALVAVAVALASVGVALVQRQRAAAAADAAALAAALHVVTGPAGACAAATALARLDHASLSGCAVAGPIVTVTVEVPLPGPLRRFGVATARARAGPTGTTLGGPPRTAATDSSEHARNKPNAKVVLDAP